MSIQVSSIESELYKLHWGSGVGDARSAGSQLSSSSVLYGPVRVVNDIVKINDGETFGPQDVIFGPRLPSAGYIVGGGLRIKRASTATLGAITLGYYSSNDVDGGKLGDIFYDLSTANAYASTRDMYQNKIDIGFPKGCFLGLRNSSDADIVDGEFSITILYS